MQATPSQRNSLEDGQIGSCEENGQNQNGATQCSGLRRNVVMVDWNLTSAQDGRLAAGWYAGGDHGVGGNFMKSVMTFVSQACSCSSLCIYTDNTLPCTMFMVLILYHGHIIEFSLR